MKDPYAILGVPKSASTDEIRRAYRKLAKSLHPDANPGDAAAEERFKQVSSAFNLLSDSDKKSRYDRGEIDGEGNERPSYHYRSRPGGGASTRGPSGRFEDISDLFSDLFTERGAGPRRAQTQKGADIKAKVQISFEEAMRGTKRRVKVVGGRQLEVNIPEGVQNGQTLRLRGQGQAGMHSAPAGDVQIEIGISPHAYFRLDSGDILLDLPISLKEALFGGMVRAPTVDGPVEVRVPAGANSGSQLRLRGKGAPKANGQRGDQIIKLIVDIPLNDPLLEGFVGDWDPPDGYDPRKRFD
jgi:DnaJ-class molecular chaperone